jgi:hypothetical protein
LRMLRLSGRPSCMRRRRWAGRSWAAAVY